MGKKVLALMCSLLLALVGTANAAEQYVIKLGDVVPESYPHNIAARKFFIPYVEKKSGGRIKVELYPNGQLGGDRQLVESLQMGTLEAALPSTTVAGSFVKELQLLDLPFMFKDIDQVHKVQDGSFGKYLSEKAEKQNLKILCFADIGFLNLTNSKRVIKSPADLKGLKIRVQESPVQIEMMKMLGATPSPMSFGEVYTALQQHVVDGQEHCVNVIGNMRFYEVQKYLSLTGENYSGIAMIFSKQFFDKLPPDLQKIVTDGARIFRDEQRKICVSQQKEWMDKLKGLGMQIYVLTPQERAEFEKITEPLRDKYGDKVYPEAYKKLQAAIK